MSFEKLIGGFIASPVASDIPNLAYSEVITDF